MIESIKDVLGVTLTSSYFRSNPPTDHRFWALAKNLTEQSNQRASLKIGTHFKTGDQPENYGYISYSR